MTVLIDIVHVALWRAKYMGSFIVNVLVMSAFLWNKKL